MGVQPKNGPSQLPRRFPIGASYVVEGFGGGKGDLRVIARYVVLPGGRRINVPTDLSNAAARRPRSSSQHAWASAGGDMESRPAPLPNAITTAAMLKPST